MPLVLKVGVKPSPTVGTALEQLLTLEANTRELWSKSTTRILPKISHFVISNHRNSPQKIEMFNFQ
jgi:hypothetical protein